MSCASLSVPPGRSAHRIRFLSAATTAVQHQARQLPQGGPAPDSFSCRYQHSNRVALREIPPPHAKPAAVASLGPRPHAKPAAVLHPQHEDDLESLRDSTSPELPTTTRGRSKQMTARATPAVCGAERGRCCGRCLTCWRHRGPACWCHRGCPAGGGPRPVRQSRRSTCRQMFSPFRACSGPGSSRSWREAAGSWLWDDGAGRWKQQGGMGRGIRCRPARPEQQGRLGGEEWRGGRRGRGIRCRYHHLRAAGRSRCAPGVESQPVVLSFRC